MLVKIFISLFLCSWSSNSFAGPKDHIKSIEQGRANPTSSPGTSDAPSASKDAWGSFLGAMFKPVVEVIFLPVFPILYSTMGLPNSHDAETPEDLWDLQASAGSGAGFKVLHLNTNYRYQQFGVGFDRLEATEDKFNANFSTLSATFTPNWSKKIKTAVGVAWRFIKYEDKTLNTKGDLDGYGLVLPNSWRFAERFSVDYTPKYIFYEKGAQVFEVALGLTFHSNPGVSAVHIGIEKKTFIDSSRADMFYVDLGVLIYLGDFDREIPESMRNFLER